MGAVQPKNLRALPFGGQAASGITHYLGASGSSFLPGGTEDRFVPSMTSTALVVTWEIINTDTTNNLLVRFGDSSGTFDPQSGQTLSNYFVLKPGVSYNFPVFERSQQVNDQVGGTQGSILLIQGSGGTCDYSGVVTVWDPNDE